MADRPDTLQLLLTKHDIDTHKAAHLRPPRGRVVVEMLPESGQIGLVLLPALVAGKLRPDVGIVLAVGPGVGLDVGALVCVRGYDGQWVDGFDAGYQTSNQVRFYGAATRFQGEIQRVGWSDSIPLQIVFESDEEIDLVATGANVVIRRDPIVERESGFFLPESAKYRTGKATVLSVGPLCELELGERSVQPGDRVCYDASGELDFAFGADPDIAIVPDIAINLVFEEDDSQ